MLKIMRSRRPGLIKLQFVNIQFLKLRLYQLFLPNNPLNQHSGFSLAKIVKTTSGGVSVGRNGVACCTAT